MASSQTNPHQIDLLSALTDELLITVLSLLPTRIAARTSALSRRFRHLWKASPSVDLSIKCDTKKSTYVAMAKSALLSRTLSNPLFRLHLDIGSPLPCHVTQSFTCYKKSFISSLLVHAHDLGLRHLTIDGYCFYDSVLRSVFSISSLEYLSIRILSVMTFPSAIALNHLKSLSINLTRYNSTQVERLLSELCCLEDLQIRMEDVPILKPAVVVCLSSQKIKKLELILVGATNPEPYSLGLSMPSLEFLSLKNLGTLENNIPHIHGEIPFIRKAVVTLHDLCQKHVTAVAQFLNCISHVEEMSLDLDQNKHSKYPFPLLLEPGKQVPTFPNLKHLDVSIHFHECNFEAVVAMLHHCTALESLKLHHKSPDILVVKRGNGNAWRSELPRNSDGDNQYACFNNLHLGENGEEFKKLINKKCTPKRLQVYINLVIEDLQLRLSTLSAVDVCLSSRTIKKLELLLVSSGPEPDSLGLSMPSLEFLCLRNLSMLENVPHIHGEIPLIRKAVVTLDCLHKKHITAVAQFLNFIPHVEELSLDLDQNKFSDNPFPVLSEPGKEVPIFPNLKHLDMSISFHECNFEAMVTMLHHSTELESLELHHKRE